MICSRFTLISAGLILVTVFYAPASLAVDASVTPLSTINLSGENSDATIAIGLSADGGSSYVGAVDAGSNVTISALIHVHPEHVGRAAEIYVVQRLGNSFTMKNADGVFVPWNVSLKSLVPAQEETILGEDVDLEIYSGNLNTSGSLRIYVGYALQDSADFVVNPVPAKFEILSVELSAFDYFERHIANIIDDKCVVCHTAGSVADGRTELLYNPDGDFTQENFTTLSNFFDSIGLDIDYVLSKASGGNQHTGGIQLPVGSSEYRSLETFLLLLAGAVGSSGDDVGPYFFSGATLLDNVDTLRRASVLLAGRLPTDTEIAAVRIGSDDVFRNTLRNLMQGDNFHEWLTDAANDRLLVRGVGITTQLLGECPVCYPAYSDRQFELEKRDREQGESNPWKSFERQMDKSQIESPLELIAWVVENDLPYSEILTADYMMFNPLLNEMLGGTATFDNPDDPWTFRPGVIDGLYLMDDSKVLESEPGYISSMVVDPGDLHTAMPHAGVLNSMAFLMRYPTTATNRNRARARWTYYFFLDVDIERSAQRSNDPVALADTNNPTMFNSACTICHERMDPVAGTYQNYSPRGLYRANFGGMDSLDEFYKDTLDDEGIPLYHFGDTWYRDMREPGYNGQLAPDPDNSLQWLAEQIVRERGFLTSAVKFWWPSVIGSEILLAPEVATDTDYHANLLAYEAQNAAIEEFADALEDSGMNLKDMLVDMLMSPWFRTASVDSDALTGDMALAHEIAFLGNEKLLTPEQLKRKTKTLTGFTWGNFWNLNDLQTYTTAMDRLYGKYYGGIDSSAITQRTRTMTAMMGTVPIVHALEVSCPVVLKEFMLPDAERRLFAGITEDMTPDSNEGAIRSKLVELHELFLGQSFAANSPQIDSVFQLFRDSWNERRNSDDVEPSLFNSTDYCPWGWDQEFGEGLDYEPGYLTTVIQADGKPVYRYHEGFLDWLRTGAEDPNYTKQGWRTVLAYLMSHYEFLYD